MTLETVSEWQLRIGAMHEAWELVEGQVVARDRRLVTAWTERLTQMRGEQATITATGGWTTGASTLMGALWVQNNEVLLTRALAWALRPDGRHRMGRAALDALARHLGLEPLPIAADVRVLTEESRRDAGEDDSVPLTRADLVVYTPLWTLIVEAKVFAPEQPQQLDRLSALWADEVAPCRVFLTRGHRTPVTARDSAGLWRPLSWAEVAAVLRNATHGQATPGGVQDVIETLEAYHHA